MNPPEWQSWLILGVVFIGPTLVGWLMWLADDGRGW